MIVIRTARLPLSGPIADREYEAKVKKREISRQCFALRKKKNLEHDDLVFPFKLYIQLCNIANYIISSSIFTWFMLLCVLVGTICVGLQTYPQLSSSDGIVFLDNFIMYSYAAEAVLKIMAEGRGPLLYFVGPEWQWNLFDVVVVLVMLSPLPGGSQLKMLRVIRLIRLGKFFKLFPEAVMILQGLAGGLKSIALIGILMFMVFYVFAIAGMVFFSRNDPWHFGTIGIAMLTLLQIATLGRMTLSEILIFRTVLYCHTSSF